MPQVKVYTTAYCAYCTRAKQLLSRKGVTYQEVDLSNDDALREQISGETGWRTVPQIFIGDEFIGGFDELKALDDAGRLDAMLANG